MVEHQLPKLRVAGSNPVYRSRKDKRTESNFGSFVFFSFSMKQLLTLILVLLIWGCAPKQTEVATFQNPVIFADVPDVDIVRVGADYYMVSTTMHLSPGAPVMHSKDLVHWETVSYLFDRLDESPKNDLEGGHIYGRGQWASSIRYHEGLYYVLFGTGNRT